MGIYLSKDGNGIPSFKNTEINKDIEDNEVLIGDNIYQQWLDSNKIYRVNNLNGSTFDEIFEEYMPDPAASTPTIEQQQIAQLLLITAQQAQQIVALQEASANG